MKILKLAFVEHDPLALCLIAWALTLPLYLILQTWFSYACAGRWRIAALIPLVGLALTVSFFIGFSYYPDLFGPPLENPFFEYPVLALAFFSPVGFIYLVVAGIAHRVRKSRLAAQ
jgi:hypothetical protein